MVFIQTGNSTGTISNRALLICYRFVEMLLREQHWLNQGLQELYKRTQNCPSCLGSAIGRIGDEQMSTHRILQQLGVLQQSIHTSTTLVEDSSLTQERPKITTHLSPERFPSSSSPDLESNVPLVSAVLVNTSMLEDESIPPSFQDSIQMASGTTMEPALHDGCHWSSLASAYFENIEIHGNFDFVQRF